MDTQLTDPIDDQLAETPEDVAILYSWANLHGAKYRDFSASRREYRAQVRHRAAEELRLAELQAKEEAEAAAAEAERVAREAERAARSPEAYDNHVDRERALQDAEEAARRAGAERVEAARRAEAAAIAEAQARREEREIAEAHASAQRQAARYAESESRRRYAAGPQPRPVGLQSDPYQFQQGSSVEPGLYTPNRQLEWTQPQRYRDEFSNPAANDRGNPNAAERRAFQSGERRAFQSGERRAYQANSGVRRAYESGDRAIFRPVEPEMRRRPQGYKPDEVSGVRPAFNPADAAPAPGPVRSRINSDTDDSARVSPVYTQAPRPSEPPRGDLFTNEVTRASERPQPQERQVPYPDARYQDLRYPDARYPDPRPPAPQARPEGRGDPRADSRPEYRQEQRQDQRPDQRPASRDTGTPAWLYGSDAATSGPNASSAPSRPPSSVDDTLQHSRERVASRWYALKGVFEPGQEPAAEAPPQRRQEVRTPVLAVFSLGGGVGKTSLVATLGRALSSLGEKVLLADTTSHGLLPYYFGASELRPGVVRTFSPPSGSTDAPIYLVSYEVEPTLQGDPNAFAQQLATSASGTNRVLLDLNSSSGWITRRLHGMAPTVLVPVAPDMNSVISLQGVEKYFAGAVDSDGRTVQPYYVLNQFDASLPLHLDVREVLRRQLGERLLPVVIRRSPSVSEALAEGMTVVDYAPDAPVAEDYMNIANWLRGVSAPASQGFRNVRWSER